MVSKSNRYRRLAGDTLILSLGLLGTKVIQFLLLPYFTNKLSTAEYGVIDVGITFASLCVPVVTFNIADAVLRFGLGRDADYKQLFSSTVFIILVATIVACACSPLIRLYRILADWYLYVTAIIIAQIFKTEISLFIKSENKLKLFALDSVLMATVIAIFDIISISVLNMGIQGYFLSEISGNILSSIFLFVAGKLYKYIDIGSIKNTSYAISMVKYSAPLLLNAVSWWITTFSDRFVLSLYSTESDIGIYSVSAKMPAVITAALSVFTQAWIISAVKEYESNKDTSFYENVYKFYESFLACSVVVCTLLIKPFMSIYVGKDFISSWMYVPVLLFGVMYLGISNFYGGIYSASKRNVSESISTMICAISNIVLNFILIPRFNIWGACVATAVSYVILVIYRAVQTRQMVSIRVNWIILFINSLLVFCEIIMVENSKYMIATLIALIAVFLNIKKLLTGLKIVLSRR